MRLLQVIGLLLSLTGAASASLEPKLKDISVKQLSNMKRAHKDGNLQAFAMVTEMFPLNLEDPDLKEFVEELFREDAYKYIEAIRENALTPGINDFIENIYGELTWDYTTELKKAFHFRDLPTFTSLAAQACLNLEVPAVKRLVLRAYNRAPEAFKAALIDGQNRQQNGVLVKYYAYLSGGSREEWDCPEVQRIIDTFTYDEPMRGIYSSDDDDLYTFEEVIARNAIN